MSFYTGKHNGKNVCHITKGSHDIVAMRGAPFSNTVFHTDIGYLDYKIFPLSSYQANNQTMYNHKGDQAVRCFKLTGEIATLIFSNKYTWSLYEPSAKKIFHDTDFFTLAYGGSTIPPVDSCLWTDDPTKYITVNVVRCVTISFPKQTYQAGFEWLITPRNKTLSIIVWGLKDSGAISPLYSQDRTGDIYINKTTFKVGNYDVLNMKYLSPNILNNVDLTLSNEGTGNTFQLINSSAKVSTVEITSNTTKTEVKKGGKVILSSDVGSQMLDSTGSVTRSLTWVYSGKKNAGVTWTYWQDPFTKIFSVGEIVSIILKPTIDGSWNPCIDKAVSLRGTAYASSLLVKYNEGYICDMSSYARSDKLLIRTKQIHGVNGKIKIKNEMIISSSYAGKAGMTSFGGIITAHSLK